MSAPTRNLRTSGTWPQIKRSGPSVPGEIGCLGTEGPSDGLRGGEAMGSPWDTRSVRRDTPSTGGTGPEASGTAGVGPDRAAEARDAGLGVRESGVRRRLHADQLGGEEDAMQVAAYRKDETDHPFSVADVLDRALLATEHTVTALSRHAQVSVTMARQWLDESTGKAPNLRHVARLPTRLRHALLWPLLGGADPAPSVAWCLGELARCMADLSGCVGDATAGATVDRIGAELVWLGTRMRAMGGGK